MDSVTIIGINAVKADRMIGLLAIQALTIDGDVMDNMEVETQVLVKRTDVNLLTVYSEVVAV